MPETTFPRAVKPPTLLRFAFRQRINILGARHCCKGASLLLSNIVHLAAFDQKHLRSSQAVASNIPAAEALPSFSERQPSERGAGDVSTASASSSAQYCVVNFYHLVDLPRPHAVLQQHKDWIQNKDILGRIYVTYQGINAQLSGPREHAQAYAEWVAQQPQFQGLKWSVDPANGHQYPRLRLKYRDNLVQLAGGTRDLPVTDQKARAEALSPTAWQKMLQSAVPEQRPAAASQSSSAPIVLDVRNSYEWDAGHFPGAQRPVEEHFNQTPTKDLPAHLQNEARERPVMMYCTGGIRCDIYSAYLRQKGFQNLYTLEGGVANYLRELGMGAWKGSLFTFDDRLAVSSDGTSLRDANLTAAAPCRCGAAASLPHLNCANIDCNRLFLACPSCQETMRGCCCEACMEAPRYLRPPKPTGRYGAWHSMAAPSELEELKGAMSSGRNSGRQAKRAKRLERLKAKHAELREQKAKRRELVKAAMAKMHHDESDSDQEPEMQATA